MRRRALLTLGLMLSGCLRTIDEPGLWPCDTEADCEDREVCRPMVSGSSYCVARDFCETDSECSGSSLCLNQRCRAVECTPAHAEACGSYACAGNTCSKSCTSASECAPGFACIDSSCSPPQCSSPDVEGVCGRYACIDGSCRTSCSSDAECGASFVCVDASCSPPPPAAIGVSCNEDAECESGKCCPHPAPLVSTCSLQCDPLPDGSSCSTDEACSSKNCEGSTCTPCADSDCTGTICAGMHCGMFEGVDCGTCSGQTYCSQNECLPACDDAECGIANGINCGTCADDLVCIDNACVPPICPPEQDYTCKPGVNGDSHVYVCNNGVTEYERETCYAGLTYCEENQADCKSYVCTPNQIFCEGEVFSTCNEDGKATLPGSRDCGAESLDCSIYGCGTVSNEETGGCPNDTAETAGAMGNVYAVTETVTLMSFGQFTAQTGEHTFRFFVYESTSIDGPYAEVYSGEDSNYSTFDVPFWSPQIGLELRAGRFYILGVEPTAGDTHYFCYDNDPDDTLSFGVRKGGYYSDAGAGGSITGPTGPGPTTQRLWTVRLQ